MQASVHTFDPAQRRGSVLLDTGRLLPFDAAAFEASGLRLLRVGQRVNLEVDGDPEDSECRVQRVWIAGIGEGQPIR